MGQPDRIPIPNSERCVWPSSREVGPLENDGTVSLTAWLRPDSGTPNAGANMEDVAAFCRYCDSFGIASGTARWRSVPISGPLDRLIDAFAATVATFETDGQQRFRHRSGALHVPANVAGIVSGIFGLHQWPRSRKLGALQRHTTPLYAREVAERYNFPEGDGSGQTIAVVQLRGRFNADDYDRCMQAQGLAPAHPVVKKVDDAAVARENATTHDLEAALDVQIIASLAPGARIVVYEAPDDERGFLDAIRDAVFDEEHAPSILSISYGWPEHLWTPAALTILDDLFAAAARAGVSVFCSSGDNGAELDYDGKPHVLAPASSPFAIACGATVIDGAAERAWEKSGGGFSERFDVPSWQGGAREQAQRYGMRAGRGVPDVAGQQMPGYYVVMDGVELAMGGTSAVAPVWAALTARVNQRRGAPIGFFSPLLYRASAGKLFGDVTEGSNGPFHAAAGWNPCTGLGVPIGTAIEEALRQPER